LLPAQATRSEKRVNGGRTCTRFSEPHGAAAPDLAPATVPLLAGEVLGPICSSEAKRSRGATAVRGSARITGKGEVSASELTGGGGTEGGKGRRDRRRRRLARWEETNWGSAVAGVRMAGQWKMEGSWVWRVGRPPCGCGPQVCFEVGPTRHSL